MSDIVLAAAVAAGIITFGPALLFIVLFITILTMFLMGTTILKLLDRFIAWRARRYRE